MQNYTNNIAERVKSRKRACSSKTKYITEDSDQEDPYADPDSNDPDFKLDVQEYSQMDTSTDWQNSQLMDQTELQNYNLFNSVNLFDLKNDDNINKLLEDLSFKDELIEDEINEQKYEIKKENTFDPVQTKLNKNVVKIPRPPNAFMIFANHWRKIIASMYPKESNKSVSVKLGLHWKALDKDVVNYYYQLSNAVLFKHKELYPGYVYNPKEARARKAERDAIKNHRVGNIPIPTNQQPQPPINQPPHMLMAPRNYGMEDMSHQSSQQPSNEQMNRTKPSLNFRPDLPPFPGFNHEFAPPYQFENPIPSCSETEMFNHGSQYPFEEVNLNSNWNFDRFIPQDYPIPESNLSNTNDIPNLMISNDDFSDDFHYRKSGSSLNILTPKALNSTVEISEQNNLLPKQSKDLYKQRSLSPDHILPYNNRETDYSETYTEVNNIHMTTSPDYDIKVTSPKSSPIEKSRLMSPVTMYKSKNISVQEQLPTQYKLSEPRDIQLSTNNFSKISNNDTSKQQSLDLNYQFNNQTVSKVHENGILSKTQNSEYRKSPKVHRSDRRSPSCKYESKKSPKQNNAFKQSISASKSKQIEIYPLPAFKQAFGGTERGRLLASPDKNSSSDITQCSGLHHSPKNNSVHESDFEYFNLNVFSENSNKFNFDEINQPFSESI